MLDSFCIFLWRPGVSTEVVNFQFGPSPESLHILLAFEGFRGLGVKRLGFSLSGQILSGSSSQKMGGGGWPNVGVPLSGKGLWHFGGFFV